MIQQQVIQFCSLEQHNQFPVIGICLNKFCKFNIAPCVKCLDAHNEHIKDFKKFDELESLVKIQQETLNITLTKTNKIKNEIDQILGNFLIKVKNDKKQLDNFLQFKKIFHLKEFQSAIIQGLNQDQQKKNPLDLLQEILEKLNSFQSEELQIPDHLIQQSTTLLNEGNQFFSQNQYDKALDLFDSVLQINPNNLESLIKKANSLKMLGHYNEALPFFNEALNQSPTQVSLIFSKGDCLRMLSRYNEAIQLFDRALSLNENHLESLIYKGECLRQLKQLQEALIWLDKALKINSKSDVALYSKGDTLRCLGKLNESETILKLGLNLNPNNPIILYSLGFTLRQLNKYQEALDIFKKCIAIEPKYQQQLNAQLEMLNSKLKQKK